MTGSALSGDGRCGTKLLRRTKGGGLGEGWLRIGPDGDLADDGKRVHTRWTLPNRAKR